MHSVQGRRCRTAGLTCFISSSSLLLASTASLSIFSKSRQRDTPTSSVHLRIRRPTRGTVKRDSFSAPQLHEEQSVLNL